MPKAQKVYLVIRYFSSGMVQWIKVFKRKVDAENYVADLLLVKKKGSANIVEADLIQ